MKSMCLAQERQWTAFGVNGGWHHDKLDHSIGGVFRLPIHRRDILPQFLHFIMNKKNMIHKNILMVIQTRDLSKCMVAAT
jgi:hypothetical protein